MAGTRRESFVQRNGLSLACFALFLVFPVAQSVSRWRTDVDDMVQHGGQAISFWTYVRTGHFAEATFENWESEFLQMASFVLLTAYLVQRGSGESKQPDGDPPR